MRAGSLGADSLRDEVRLGAGRPVAVPTGLPRWAARAEAAAVFGIVLAAVSLRFADLGVKSLWFDEAFAVHMARQSVPDLLRAVRTVDAHPPLYYLLLHVWMGLAGQGEAAIRALGALLSAATVPGTWWLGRRLGGVAVGCAAALLVAVSPFHVQAAQEARMYPLLGLVTLGSWAALLRAVEGARPAWIGYVAATAAMLYTHYLGLVTVLAQGLFVLATTPRARPSWLASQLAVVVLWSPWAPTFFDSLFLRVGAPLFRPPVGLDTVTDVLGLLSFGGYAFGFPGYQVSGWSPAWFQALVLVPFVAVLVVGFGGLAARPRAFWLLLAYLVLPLVTVFAISLRYNIIYARYFSYLVAPFAIVLAAGLLHASAWVGMSSRRLAVLGGLLVLVVVQAWVLDEYYVNPRFAVYNWRAAARLVASAAGPDDVVLVTPGYTYVAFEYYFRGRQRVLAMTPVELLDAGAQRVIIDPGPDPGTRPFFRALATRHPVVWLVATTPAYPNVRERFLKAMAGIYEVKLAADYIGLGVEKWVRAPAPRRDVTGR